MRGNRENPVRKGGENIIRKVIIITDSFSVLHNVCGTCRLFEICYLELFCLFQMVSFLNLYCFSLKMSPPQTLSSRFHTLRPATAGLILLPSYRRGKGNSRSSVTCPRSHGHGRGSRLPLTRGLCCLLCGVCLGCSFASLCIRGVAAATAGALEDARGLSAASSAWAVLGEGLLLLLVAHENFSFTWLRRGSSCGKVVQFS